jgi:biopolymer transport protein ExbB
MLDFDRLHELTFIVLFACPAVLTFVLLERVLYFAYLALSARRITGAIAAGGGDPEAGRALGSRRDVLSRSIGEYVAFQRDGAPPRPRVDDLSNALFLRVDGKLHARLWVLDTIVTAAPLLGLLGTIFGIMQTFESLSAGGISDPAAVSRGIGSALQATALGIGTALYGLLGHNALHRQAEHLVDEFKMFLLRTTR